MRLTKNKNGGGGIFFPNAENFKDMRINAAAIHSTAAKAGSNRYPVLCKCSMPKMYFMRPGGGGGISARVRLTVFFPQEFFAMSFCLTCSDHSPKSCVGRGITVYVMEI